MNARPFTPPMTDGPIAEGTVGWADDGGNAIDLGDTPNDGNSLVRVTLFRGKDPTVALDQTKAQGQRVLCRVETGVLRIPVYGARVIVARVDPWGDIPGSHVIIGTIDPGAWKKFGNASPGDVYIPSGSGATVVAVKANGTFAVKTSNDNTATGRTIGFSVGSTGLQFTSPWASIQAGQIGALKATGIFLKTAWGSALKLYGVGGMPGLPPSLSSIIKMTAGILKSDSSQIMQGPDTPGTQFVPTVAALDPGGAPLLSALLAALPGYLDAVQAVLGPLGANALNTGVTPAQVAAVATAQGALSTAIATTGGILTTTSVKVAAPAP